MPFSVIRWDRFVLLPYYLFHALNLLAALDRAPRVGGYGVLRSIGCLWYVPQSTFLLIVLKRL
jgi:hypothetical protein